MCQSQVCAHLVRFQVLRVLSGECCLLKCKAVRKKLTSVSGVPVLV